MKLSAVISIAAVVGLGAIIWFGFGPSDVGRGGASRARDVYALAPGLQRTKLHVEGMT